MEKIDIKGCQYFVNTDSMLFQNTLNSQDIIRVDVLLDQGTHYEMLDVVEGSIKSIKLPQFVNADPEGMRTKYGIEPGVPLPVRDAEFTCRQDLLENRIRNHMRTVVQIDKWKYKVDGYSGTIRPCFTIGQQPAFNISDFETIDTGYRIYIDLSSGFIIPRKFISDKGNYIYADLPDLYVLDPVGTSKNAGVDHHFYTQRFPVRAHIDITTVGNYKVVAVPKLKKPQKQIPASSNRRKIR